MPYQPLMSGGGVPNPQGSQRNYLPQGTGGNPLTQLLNLIFQHKNFDGTRLGLNPNAGDDIASQGGPTGVSPYAQAFSQATGLNLFTGGAPPQEVQAGQSFSPAPPEQTDPIQAALAQLAELMNSGTSGPSTEDMQASLDQAAAGINKQYGAGISALRQQNAGARQDTKEGSAKIQKMYQALNKSYVNAGKREGRQGAQLNKQLQGLANNSQQTIGNQAKQMNQQSAEAAAGLGLADLGESLIGQTNKNAQQLQGQANARGQMAGETVLGQMGNNRTYMNTQGQTSKLEGTNRSADLFSQLQDYLQGNRSQIAELAGQRAQALAAAKASIQGSYASATGDAHQQDIDNQLELLKQAMAVQDQQFDQNYQMQQLQGNDSANDYLKLLPDQMSGPMAILNQFKDPQMKQLYGQLSGQPEMGTGYFNVGGDANNRQSLIGNYTNLQQFLNQTLGPNVIAGLKPGEADALVAALMMQLQGMTPTKAMQ